MEFSKIDKKILLKTIESKFASSRSRKLVDIIPKLNLLTS